MRSHDGFQIEDFRGGNFRWIDQRQGPVGRFQDLIVSDNGRPLQR